jgi:cytochrome d ubiquinol oxidase subunit II
VTDPASLLALTMLVALIAYALLGGADFGGGMWDLASRGPRAPAQRRLIEDAIGPIWEANHVWLILVVVLLFSAFPRAYAVAGVALHIPLTLLLLGIVLRGSAFVFRHYSPHSDVAQHRWGRVFAIASTVTPIFLGIVLGAITAGTVRLDGSGRPVGGFVAPWLGVFPVMVGLFALALFAFLAAVYLTNETGERALQEDFRRRALWAGVAVGVLALGTAISVGDSARSFRQALFGSWWSWPLQLATGAAAVAAFAALYLRRYRLARASAAAQVALILGGWGLAQRPYLIAPDVTVGNAAADPAVLHTLVGALVAGALLLFPSLWWLYRVFKRRQPET